MLPGCGRGREDLAPNRPPARCLPGAPSPQPLSEPRKLTIATGTLSAEYVAPLQVALGKGEFKKEGLDVTLKVLPTPDALPLLAKGDIDALWAAPEAAFMNGHQGRLRHQVGRGELLAGPEVEERPVGASEGGREREQGGDGRPQPEHT